jgi:O-antigen ligase
MMKTLAKLSLWALAFVPLVVTPSAVFPYVFGKMLLMRAALLLASILFVFIYANNRLFRIEVRAKFAKAIRNPLTIAVLVFVALASISAFTAVSPFKAFFGDLERGEGLLELWYYFAFFAYSYLLFDHDDWVMFFKFNVIAGLISFAKAMADFMDGAARTGAWAGNPEFLAGHFLFVIFCSAVVFANSSKKSLWRYGAAIGGLAGVTGTVLTQTRGAIMGLGVAAVALAVCGLIYGKDIKLTRRVNVRGVALALLVMAVMSIGLFWATKDATIWQKIPGVSRIARADTDSSNSISTRLIALKTSWKAATESGPARDLLGYGPDNYNYAFNRFYDPTFYKYEHAWFDRAHNKLADVVVMSGWLGLLAYLAIWATAGYLLLKAGKMSVERLAILLFGASYFTFLMTVFDQVTTYIPFFATLVFLLRVSTSAPTAQQQIAAGKRSRRNGGGKREPGLGNPTDIIVFVLIGTGLIWSFIAWTLVPFNQQTNYKSMVESLDDPSASADTDSIFTPYSYAQEEIRIHFLATAINGYNKADSAYNLFLKALPKTDEAAAKDPNNPRILLLLGTAYGEKAMVSKDKRDLDTAEAYLRRALKLSPLRQEVVYTLIANLTYQNKTSEALALAQKEVMADGQTPESHYYLGYVISKQGEQEYGRALVEMERAFRLDLRRADYPPSIATVYKRLARYFYRAQDRNNFLTAMDRLDLIIPGSSSANSIIIKSVQEGSWPDMDIK